MGAYDEMDRGIAGLKMGVDSRVESRAAQEDIAFGLPVFSYIGDDDKCWSFKNDVGKLVFDGDFVTSNVITITVNGVDAADVTFATDHDTTADLVVAAVAALTGVECVLDSTDATNRTFLIRVKGETALVAEAITGGAGQVTGTITYGSGQIFVGVSMHTHKEPKNATVGALYEQYDPVNVMVDGWIMGEIGAAVNSSTVPYVITAVGSTLGQFGAAGEALTGYYIDTLSAAGIGQLRVKGGLEAMTYGNIAFA